MLLRGVNASAAGKMGSPKFLVGVIFAMAGLAVVRDPCTATLGMRPVDPSMTMYLLFSSFW